MRMPDPDVVASMIAPTLRSRAPVEAIERFGRVVEIGPTLIKASLPDLGDDEEAADNGREADAVPQLQPAEGEAGLA